MSPAPTTCASHLSDDLQKSRRTAYRKYAELLSADAAAPDAPEQIDAKSMTQLRTLAASLGKSPADVESDARVLRAAANARTRIDRARGSSAAQRSAKSALDAHDAETARLLAERREGYRALYAEYRSLGALHVGGMDAVHHLNALIDRHAELLAHLDRVTDHDLE